MKKAVPLLVLLASSVPAEEPRPAEGASAVPADAAPAAAEVAEPVKDAEAAKAPEADMFAEADRSYEQRDAPGEIEKLTALLEAAEKAAPKDFEVLWRLARLYSWTSDDPAIMDKEKSRLGKIGWDLAERAIAADPTRVEGWHFAAVNMGQYSLGIGILRALGQGIEGKFKDRLSHAERIDPGYSGGAIPTAWGRFWFKLPWPKYDGKKSEQAFLEALRRNPDNVRARVYLADLYEKEDEGPKAREQLERAAAGEPGRYDAPEERRYQEVARQRLVRPERR
jgi:tetratricopeptide (TPR) repeat protein